MCLYVKKGCKPEIAQKDILCYKVIKLLHDGHHWCSIYRYTYQPYNKVLRAKDDSLSYSPIVDTLCIGNGRYTGSSIIDAGLHAFCTEKEAKRELTGRGSDFVMRLAVIPKGTEYCLGEDDDIVATKMIVFGSEKAYQKYKKGLL